MAVSLLYIEWLDFDGNVFFLICVSGYIENNSRDRTPAVYCDIVCVYTIKYMYVIKEHGLYYYIFMIYV